MRKPVRQSELWEMCAICNTPILQNRMATHMDRHFGVFPKVKEKRSQDSQR
jgi:hypothetical protein